MSGNSIDLNAERAARREGSLEGLKVTLGDDTFTLPSELPVDVFAPFRDIIGDDDLPSIVQTLAESSNTDQALTAFLRDRPNIAVEALDALRFALGRLFCTQGDGCDLDALSESGRSAPTHAPECQWPRFLKQRPSMPDYLALGRGLLAGYGVSLGEALGSSDSSGSDGATSNPTSRRSTSSTPAKRSQPRQRKASSA